MKRYLLHIVLLAPLLVIACSASKKAFKQAKEYEKAGLYVEAAEYDIRALKEKSNFKDAKAHLRKVAPLAYEELVKQGETHEAAENWDLAVGVYGHLKRLLEDFSRYGVVLETVNVNARLNRSKRHAAEAHYQAAEAFFRSAKWQKAANAYLKAHHFIDNYNKSFTKAIQSFVNAGNRFLKRKEYRKALKMYDRALVIAPGHRLVRNRMANAHYLLGRRLFERNEFRKALTEFQTVEEFVPGFSDVERWVERAYAEAVQFVAVVPFLNESRVAVDGYFLASEILQLVQHADLEFAEFMDHASTVAMVSSIRRGRHGSVSEAQLLDAAEQEGLDAIIWGKIRDVAVKDKPEAVTEYEYERVVVVQDSAGKDIEQKEPIYYREHVRRRTIRLVVEFVILDCETGKYLDKQRLSEDLVDDAVWIAYQGSMYDLPEGKRALLDAPRNPREVPVLLDILLQRMSERIAKQVARFYEEY